MAYRRDNDLEFLQYLDSKELGDLTHLLVYDKDGKKRWSEGLSSKEVYKKHHPMHAMYWRDIAEEIQRYGANGIATLLRGKKGVLYREVLLDVCEKMGVKFDKTSSTLDIEDSLLMKMVQDSVEKMSPDELKSFTEGLGVTNLNVVTPQALMAIIQGVFRAGGFQSYKLTLIVVNAISKAMLGRGLTFAGNAALTRTVSVMAGPIGWAVAGIWTAVDLAGPAYRVTIPAVIHVAFLRKQSLLGKEDLKEDLSAELGV